MPSWSPNRHPDWGPDRGAGIRTRGEGGFTLIELLVAVATLATLVTLVSLSFSSTFMILEVVDEEQGRVHQARLCLSRIADELIMARRQATSPWIGRNGDQNGQPSDFLTFVSTSHMRNRANALETDLTRVLYAQEGTRLLRFARPNLYELPHPLIEQVELAQGVIGFNLRYYDRALSAWVDEWDGRTRSELPTAIMIELILGHARNEPRTFTEWVTLPGQTS
ncbi:MAG: prepilin-type N-terminal cleavage/methylation domain-containing protein [Nitrospirota bacterium]|nr:prepilin-type N-terminal cleavage/methylation domain-containing protein [Nitrospirota bacterium]MDE3225500.1 prepilin-type N-terminal cleavage/methylation domain-containing protein [Nitrospirota bacterium]MDE3242851.1 prepilin-type N-terminal cleavage/methylation domain-containing protein [Nitrospirota bacterium]